MRLLELHFRAYGCFTDVRLDLSNPGHTLHVIYGPNEAGKSTALRGLTDFLYGIPTRSTDNFLHKNSELRVAARLLDEDQQEHEFVRRKGNKDTLSDPDGTLVPETVLGRLLRGLPRDLFESLFRIDHPSLVEGGHALLDGKGDLATTLFQAGAGILGVRQVMTGLDADADRIFKPKASNPRLNQALQLFQDKKKQIRDAALPASEWKKLSAELEENEQRLRDSQATYRDLAAKLERLKRIQAAQQQATKRRELQRSLTDLGPVPHIVAADIASREETTRRLAADRERCELARQRIADGEEKIARLAAPLELLNHAAAIEDVVQRVNSYRNATADLPKRERERLQLEAEARAKLADARPDLSLDEVGGLRLTAPERSKVQRLVGEFAKLETRLSDVQGRIETLERKTHGQREELTANPPPSDPSDLQRVLSVLRREGVSPDQVHEQQRAIAELTRKLQIELPKLNPWRGSVEELEALAVPTAEVVEAFQSQWTALELRRSQLRQQRTEWKEQDEQYEEEIRVLIGETSVPSEAALAAARARRAEGWRLIQARLAAGANAPDPAQEQAYAGVQSLETAFARDIDTADDIADRLRSEADRVAQLAKLTRDREGSQRRGKRLENDERDLAGELEDWTARWRSTWTPVGLEPDSPLKMRGWLSRHGQLVDLAAELQRRRAAALDLESRLRQQSTMIRAELAKLGIVEVGELSPSLLTHLAEDQVARLTTLRQERAAAEAEVSRQVAELEGYRQDRAKLHGELEKWRTVWSEITQSAAADPEAHPEEVQSTLAKIDEVCEGLASIADKEARIADMQSHIDEFRSAVASLTAVVAPDIAGLRPDEGAAELQRRLSAAQRVAGERKTIERQLTEERQTLDEATLRIAAAESELAELLRRADCVDLASLVALEQKSLQAKELREKLREVDEALSGFAAGADLNEFLNEVTSVDADRLPVEIADLAQQQKDLESRRSECQQEVGRLRSELERRNGGAAAVVAAQEAQDVLATIREQAEEYVRLKIAGGILRRYLERYRQETQDPVLKRASALFARLSTNSFGGIRSDFNEKDEPILQGVRPSGAVVDVSGMSDGTRDQLFLAFRLANLERQLETQARLPLVVDDILINFDDARSKATLEVLAEIARQTQVLFFTHHERLVELAQSVVPPAELAVHRLSR